MSEPTGILRRPQRPRYLGAAVALLVPLWLFWVLNDRIMKGAMGYDEQFFVWGGWSITRGLHPYVDFFEFKPPMVFITHAFAILAFGDKGLHYRIYFSVFAALSTIALHLALLSRRIDRALTVAVMCALILAWVNPIYHDNALQDAESIGLSYYFLGLAALIAETGRYRKYFEVAGGALLACTVLSKEPFTGSVLGTWVTAFLFVYGTRDFATNALRYLKLTTLGVLTTATALAIYMVPSGALRRYIELVIEYAALFRDPHTSYCVILGRWHPSTMLAEIQAQIKYIHEEWLNTTDIGYLTPFFVTSFAFIWGQSKVLFASAFATFLLALYAVTATNCQWLHYYNMPLSGTFFFFIVGVDRMNARIFFSTPAVRRYIAALIFGVVGVYAFPRVEQELRGWPYVFAMETEPLPGVFDFVAKNSAPGDKIFTTGPPQLYMYVHRDSALRESSILDEFIIYYPGNTDVERVSSLRAQLVKNRPKIVIVDPEHANRKQRHMAALITPFLTEFHYRQVGPYYYVRPD